MEIKYARQFIKMYKKSPVKIQRAFDKRAKIFINDPYNRELNNHPLKGEFKKFRSIDLTGDWRAHFTENTGCVIFVAMGTHSQLYK